MQDKDITRNMNSESNDVDDLNVDNPTNTKHGIKVVGESSRPLSFRERMKSLSPHHLPLKERMRDKIISCVDVFRLGSPPSRRDDEKQPRVCRRSETHKYGG